MMKLDIRLPLGLMFALIGALLILAGIVGPVTSSSGALAININLWWGLVMLCFGASMLWLSKR
jgi:hypothetical protein